MTYNISLQDREKVFDLLIDALGHRKKIPSMVKALRDNPNVIQTYLGELDAAIQLFRDYRHEESVAPLRREDFVHARSLSAYLQHRDLPSVVEIISMAKDNSVKLKAIVPLLNQFEFLDTMSPPLRVAAAFTILLYRSVLLVVWSDAQMQHVLVGSAIEEMLCLTALRGKVTHLFRAVKSWILDNEYEGFSSALSQAIKQL